MRRAILAVTIGGVLLSTSACDSTAKPETAPASAEVAPSAAPASSAPDYSASTALVCGKVQKIFDGGLKDFATDLGKMIANKEAKQTAPAAAAQKAAAKELNGVGQQVKAATATAEDPEIQTAGAASAAKFVKTAADKSFFDKIKTTKDLDRIIEAQINEWFTPIAGYCSAADPSASPSASADPSASS